MSSHLGIKPEDHVVLELVATEEPTGAWQRNFPDAATQFPFLVPEGRYLVITDVDWQFQLAEDPQPQNVTFRLFVAPLDDLTNSYRVLNSTTMLDDMGYGGRSEAMTTGFVVAESATIVWDSIPATEQVVHIQLRGYLVDRQ